MISKLTIYRPIRHPCCSLDPDWSKEIVNFWLSAKMASVRNFDDTWCWCCCIFCGWKKFWLVIELFRQSIRLRSSHTSFDPVGRADFSVRVCQSFSPSLAASVSDSVPEPFSPHPSVGLLFLCQSGGTLDMCKTCPLPSEDIWKANCKSNFDNNKKK